MAGINDALRDYCTSAAVADWDGKDWVRELHIWFDLSPFPKSLSL